jgi:hypothetical protein
MKKYWPIALLALVSIIINFNMFINPLWGFMLSLFGLFIISLLLTVFGVFVCKKLKLSEIQSIWGVAVFNFLLSLYGKLAISYMNYVLKDQPSLINSINYVDKSIQHFQLYYAVGLIIIAVLVLFVTKYKWAQRLFMNISLFALSITLFNRVYSYTETATKLKPIEVIDPQKSPLKGLPDIYFVLMDGYTGNTALKKYWKFDNNEFKDTLNKLGFTISDSARGRMPATIGALSLTLNASDFHNPRYSLSNMDLVTQMYVKDNGLYRILKKNNYQIESKSIFWDDMPFFFGQGEIDPKFTFLCPIITRNFIFRLMVKAYNSINNRSYTIANWLSDYDDKIEKELIAQERGLYAADSRPHFVFNHLFYTHNLFRYDSTGKRLPLAQIGVWDPGYIHQVKYNNQICVRYFSNLIKAYQNKNKLLVIIALSDHGSRENRIPDEDSQIQLVVFDSQHKLDITDQQSGSVNLIRTLLNKYFGYNLAKQPYSYHNYYKH